MAQKIAVAIIHGIGLPDPNFADGMIKKLKKYFLIETKQHKINPDIELVMKPVFWAPVIQDEENKLWQKMKQGGKIDYRKLRRFMVDFAGDAIAYQPTSHDRKIYDNIHQIMAETLNMLAQEAGPNAPLCIIAHSLGTVIGSNYIYDLEVEYTKHLITKDISSKMGDTPLEKCETLTAFYTMGSPIALWSLRYLEFGKPITVPSSNLSRHYPNLQGEWINFYDKDDIIGYPLKTINDKYMHAVKEDKQVNIGNIFSSWNPASHIHYWKDKDITKPIAKSLAKIWLSVNNH